MFTYITDTLKQHLSFVVIVMFIICIFNDDLHNTNFEEERFNGTSVISAFAFVTLFPSVLPSFLSSFVVSFLLFCLLFTFIDALYITNFRLHDLLELDECSKEPYSSLVQKIELSTHSFSPLLSIE